MEIDGLPLHPLIVHAVVVLVPLTCLLAIGFAVLPGWRWLTRWVTVALAVFGAVAAFLATRSGESLENARPYLRALVREHAEHGDRLQVFTLVLAVLVVVSALLLPGPSGLASGRGARESRVAVLDKVLPVLLVLACLVVAYQVYLTGESGARAVWQSTGGG
jgi:uncharacterized membrane protein